MTAGNTQTAPSNLTVTAVPSTDGSGNVAFTATATNAVTYDYEFGRWRYTNRGFGYYQLSIYTGGY